MFKRSIIDKVNMRTNNMSTAGKLQYERAKRASGITVYRRVSWVFVVKSVRFLLSNHFLNKCFRNDLNIIGLDDMFQWQWMQQSSANFKTHPPRKILARFNYSDIPNDKICVISVPSFVSRYTTACSLSHCSQTRRHTELFAELTSSAASLKSDWNSARVK